MLHTSPAPADRYADRYVERPRTGVGRRAVAIGATLLIEAILLLFLLSLGRGSRPGGEEALTVVDFAASDVAEEAPDPVEPEERAPEPEQPAPRPDAAEPTPQPPVPVPLPPQAVPMPPPAAVIPMSREQMARVDIAPQRPPAAPGPVYGPPDTGAPASLDSERVGTAPNGEPLYAARWYREPTDGELRGYLSTASGPGWGLIACRTAPDYRVEDCVALDEYPQGSMMNRAILAATWQFKVRPPRLGGRDMVGEWVRIRIDYRITRR